MDNEYIIISKTAIGKRIEELEKQMNECISHASKTGDYDYQFEDRLDELKQVLSQSTPLIPEIKKAFTAGERYGWDSQKSIGNIDEMREKIKLQSLDNYITNLKLDI